jgi:hypothetical protein
MRSRLLVLLVATLGLGAVVAPTTGAVTGARVAAYLDTHPGGTPLDANTISYAGGALIVSLRAPASVLGSPDCPLNWFCFYDRPNFGYPRGKLSDCGTQDLATWYWQDRVESVHNKTSSTVDFYDGSVGSGPLLFSVGANGTKSSVTPYQNRANYVTRHC